jgi:glycosyltransferase involved in cell wall biosynthesis
MRAAEFSARDAEEPGGLAACRARRRSVAVALAVFNGENHLDALLASLFAQTRSDFTVTIADDGSTDRSLEIVAHHARAHPNRVLVLPAEGRVGAGANFSRLLSAIDADFVLLCDQDDVWLPDKVETTVQALVHLEADWGPETPLLVHTDLVIVDADLKTLHPSLARFERLSPGTSEMRHLLLGNVATGCTIAANRALLRRALPVPATASMHDHWFALVASAIGRRIYLPRATILYRQHSGNVIGVTGWSMRAVLGRAGEALFGRRKRSVLKRYSRQAGVLLHRYGAELRPTDRAAAAAVAGLWEKKRSERIFMLVRHRVGLPGAPRRIAILIAGMLIPRTKSETAATRRALSSTSRLRGPAAGP